MNNLKIRITAQACLIRLDRGEGSLDDIIDSYQLSQEHRMLVFDAIAILRPSMKLSE